MSPGDTGRRAATPDPTLTWGASAGADELRGMRTTRRTTARATASWTNVGNATSQWPERPDATITQYHWQVRAVNAGGTTRPTAGRWWSFTDADRAAGGVRQVAAGQRGDGRPTSPTLTWGASARATSYEYCYDTTNDGACSGSWTTTARSPASALSGLAMGRRTTGRCARGTGAGRRMRAAARPRTGASRRQSTSRGPSEDDAGKRGDGTVDPLRRLTWTPSTGATSYEVCADTWTTTRATAWRDVGTATSITWPGPALEHDTTYYWQVRAVNAGGTTLGGRADHVVELPDAGGAARSLRQVAAGERRHRAADEQVLTWGPSEPGDGYDTASTRRTTACGGSWTTWACVSATARPGGRHDLLLAGPGREGWGGPVRW